MMLGDSMREVSKSLQNLSAEDSQDNHNSSSIMSKSVSNFGYSPKEDEPIVSPIMSSSSSLSHHSQTEDHLTRVDENSDSENDAARENLKQ